VASHLRQHPHRAGGNRALFPILDRAGDCALFDRILDAAAVEAALVISAFARGNHASVGAMAEKALTRRKLRTLRL